MATLELHAVADRHVDRLSGGELQRFALALCCSQAADVFVVDEPSSYLDVKQRLKAAYDEACLSVPEETPAKLLHGLTPSAGAYWELQRRPASQPGPHARLTPAFSLRTSLPHSIVLRRDVGAAELVEYSPPALSAGCDAVPFRLTRLLQNFITPLGIDGAFSGAICAASECLAAHQKCFSERNKQQQRRKGGISTAAIARAG